MVRVTITEAANRLGLSTDAVRRKIRAEKLPAQRDNRQQWWVELPDDLASPTSALAAAPPYAPMQAPAVEQHSASALAAPLAALEGEATALRDLVHILKDQLAKTEERTAGQLAKAEAQVLEENRRHLAEQEQAAGQLTRAEANAAEERRQRLVEQERAAGQLARAEERTDQAGARAARAEEQAATARDDARRLRGLLDTELAAVRTELARARESGPPVPPDPVKPQVEQPETFLDRLRGLWPPRLR